MGQDTARLLAIREQEAATAARQALLIEQLLVEVRGLRDDLKTTTNDLHGLKLEQTQLKGEIAQAVGTLNSRVSDHDRQLSDVWGKFDQKSSAWSSVVPTIVGTVAAQILGLSVLGGILYSMLKDAGKAASGP